MSWGAKCLGGEISGSELLGAKCNGDKISGRRNVTEAKYPADETSPGRKTGGETSGSPLYYSIVLLILFTNQLKNN